MVSPEQCCAYFSMIAAEQRLKVNYFIYLIHLFKLIDFNSCNELAYRMLVMVKNLF